jgi:hypothetical protein
MLPPFVIDQIRRRQEQERARQRPQQPYLEVPLGGAEQHAPKTPDEEAHRGIVIIDLGRAD